MYVPYANHHASKAFNGKFTDWKKLPDGTHVCFICDRKDQGG